jgi:hypothetical protein
MANPPPPVVPLTEEEFQARLVKYRPDPPAKPMTDEEIQRGILYAAIMALNIRSAEKLDMIQEIAILRGCVAQLWHAIEDMHEGRVPGSGRR